MKFPLVVLLGFVFALTLGGCATISPEESSITRFVRVPADALSKTVAATAAKRKYRTMDDGRFERVIMYEKDPVLGLVTVSDKAQVAIRFSMKVEAVTEKTSRLTAFPVAAFRNPFSGNYSEKPLPPGGSDRAEVASLIDAAITDALAEYEKQTAGPTPTQHE